MDAHEPARVEALQQLRDAGAVQVFLGTDVRILDDNFQSTGVAVAVPKNRPAALAYITAFIESALDSGLVQQALDDAGIRGMATSGGSRP